MRLFIATRISVAREIAFALSAKNHSYKRQDGYFDVGDDVVSWCGGHLLELADPEAYDTNYQHWRMEHLPIIPGEWQLKERSRGHEQLEILRHLHQQANEIIHAGDPDREGQWMIDELLGHLGNRLPVKRLLIQDLNLASVRKALGNLRDNSEFINLSESAMARSRADWLYGINMTRAYTLLGRHSGHEGVLPVGRVQTPVLALVVKHDEEIEKFKPERHLEIFAKITSEDKKAMCIGLWQSSAGEQLLQDPGLCESLAEKVQLRNGEVASSTTEIFSESPPLPFSLSALQIACGNNYGYSAKDVLEGCLHLYEKHHLISYPRSDCRYLPEEQFDSAAETLDAIANNLNDEKGLHKKIQKSDCWIKQKAWCDTKIHAHHAITPTIKRADIGSLSEQEKNIYRLISENYVSQFYPDYQYSKNKINFLINGETFIYNFDSIIEPGWRNVIFPDDKIKKPQDAQWKFGDIVHCDYVDVKEKLTRPPARFTDATLMGVMSNISAYVKKSDITQFLDESNGLGTETTRASIIDGLLNRGYLMKGTKSIFSTAIARDLIHALPDELGRVDVVAVWEKQLSDIADGKLAYRDFMASLERQLTTFMQYARDKKNMSVTSVDEVLGLPTAEKFYCTKCHSLLILREGKRGAFWGCSRYPECKNTTPDIVEKNGKHRPDFIARAGGAKSADAKHDTTGQRKLDKNCPDCGKPLVKRKGKRGAFAGCSGFPACTHTEPLLSDREIVD